MEGIVHNFGNYLEDCVKNDSWKEAGKVIKLVRRCLDDNIADNSLNYAISKLFDDPYNILKFLSSIRDKANQKGWREVLLESLELINHLLNNFYNKLRPYTLEIVKICRIISTSNAHANDKSKAINIISDVLKKDSDIPLDDVQNIYESYFKFCTVHQKTTSAKVQRGVFVLLGIISNKYPFIINNQNTLIDTYVIQLKRQSECSEKDRDNTVVSGCIDGLSNILETFPIETEDSKSKIYNIISKLLLSGSTRFDIRDVVKFISRHCSMFMENIYNHVPELWFETIKKWALSKGENRKAGYVALETFYDELAKLLQHKNDQKAKNCFQHFFDYFLGTMKDENADIIEVRLAIRGYGSFSTPCKVHLETQNLSQMFMIIVNRIEQDYFIKEHPSVEQLEYLPDYIHCFSAILFQIGAYTFDQIDSLQQISILMIKAFPKLSPIYHFSVFDSLILCMCYLYQKNPKFLENYLQRVVYQGVLWTCSHRTCFEVNEDEKTVTYKNFLILWQNLLNFVESNNVKYSTIHIDTKNSVVQMIYDELIKTLLLLVNKLNLNTKLNEEIYNPEAEKIDDFIIFINVVDFYLELFQSINNDKFKKWIKIYTNQIISKSYKYPNVSGFYKLLKLGLNISETLKYFDKDKEDRQILYKKIFSYLEKVLENVHEFKDDLQISCLQLLLTVPQPFVAPLLPTITPVFEMSLIVGFSYIKFAETAVDTLDKWYKVVPTENLKPLLKAVLPYLDPFLRSSGFVGDPDIKIEMKKSKRSKKRKVLIEQDAELTKLQNKILLFIGQLDSEICLHLIDKNMNIDQVTWENEPFLKFTVPYTEIKPNIYLDKILPRILELSLSCGDQKTRITSCELLHSITIFMLGKSRQMSQSNQMVKLFEKIFLPLIQLGCDSNDVVRQLFNPLVYQMVHWYASPLQLMSNETTTLIDVLMEGISHPNNTSIRDLSSKLIKEFVIWTIKQSNKDDLEKHSQNIDNIVRKICHFCFHPNSFKRLGSALAFNSLYTYLREEETMIDEYWIEIMYSLLTAMSLESEKSKSNIHFDNALNHIERVLREKNCLFNKHSIKRRVPQEINSPLLKDATLFILKQTKSNNTKYRRKCIQLFCNISPYVENTGCVKNFIHKFLSEIFFLDYEPYMVDLTSYKNLGTVEIIFKWMESLLKSLDVYKFLFEYDVVNTKLFIQNTNVFKSILYFLQEVSSKNLENTLKLFSQYDSDYICLPIETETFSESKISLIISIFDYLLSIIDKNTEWCEILCNECFYNFINNCVFEPQNFGFDKDTDLSKKILELFNKFAKKLPQKYLNELTNNLSIFFQKNYNKNINLNTNNIPLSQRNLLKGWLLIQNSNLKVQNCQNFEVIEIIFKNLVKENNKGIKLQSTVLEYCDLLLQLSFKINKPSLVLCDTITNTTEIKHPELYSNISSGEYFLNMFEETIMEYILIYHNECIKILCGKWTNFNDKTPMNVLILILKYLSLHLHLKQKLNINDFFENVMFGCYPVYKSSKDLNLLERNFQIELLTHVIKIDKKNATEIGAKYKFIKAWIIEQLNYNSEMSKNILQFHTNVLYFLFCFNDNYDPDLKSCMNTYIEKILNAPSDKIENSDLLVFFKKLLDYLIISKSQIILNMSMKILTKLQYDEENIYVQKSLEQYLRSIAVDQQYQSIKEVFEYSNTLSEEKYKLVKTFLVNLLRFSSYEVFEEFYVQNIEGIINNLKENVTINSTGMDIVNKTSNLLLLDLLFSRIKIENFANKSCKISQQIVPEMEKGNELLKISMEIVNQILKENIHFSDNRKELYRLYHCQAYNTLISIICNTKNPNINVKGYRLLFFMTKDDKNIWKNIINCEETISIPQDFNKIPSRKKVFINIRIEHQVKIEQNIKYIESQSLFNSTLSEDICKFDFTNTLVRNPDFIRNTSQIENSPNILSLKSIDYNNHECMATICALINHMVDFNISPLPIDSKMAALPLWMEDLKKILMSECDKNIRIFIARVVHNTQNVFKHYGKYFFEAIVKFILDKCTGENINYFVADLVFMLISWQENLEITEIKQPASDLLQFLMEHSCNDRQDMLKYNLEIIKTCVQLWNSIIEIPHQIILQKLKHNNFQEKLVAIHLSGIILANDLQPWTNENLENFVNTIVDILNKEKLKKITKPCAELIGMMLNYFKEKRIDSQLLNKVDVVLKQPNSDKFFHSIEQIQIHYPEIIDKYIRKICLCVFSESDTSLKCICLKNILRNINNTESIRFTYKDVIDLLNIDDRDILLLTLQIINNIFKDFKKQHQLLILQKVLEQKSNSNSMIRYAVFEILLSVYHEHAHDTDANSVEIWKMCRPVLLTALIDPDIEIQEKMENDIFNNFSHLKFCEKYNKLLIDLYSPDTEHFYIGFLNYFVLNSCKDAPEYKKLLFEHPLYECKFDEYQLIYNWRLQNSMAPLFSHSIRHFDAPQLIGVRETNSYKIFTPTLSSINLRSSSLETSSSFLVETNRIQKEKKEETMAYGKMFLSEKSRSLGFAKEATVRNIQTEQLRKERVKRKEKNVVIYRQYRKADLPDIQIPYSDLIDPLKILAKRDAILSQQLHVMLFSGIVNELDNSDKFIQDFNSGINDIFNQSYMFVPNMVGAFLDTTFENNKKKNVEKIYINSDTLSNVCKNSGLLPIGCLLMEEYINIRDELPTTSKKGCGNSDNEIKQWVKLADMYKELNEWDAVIGIFSSDFIQSSSEISTAIHSEANCNFKDAITQYESLLNTDTNAHRKDFYYESFFKCFANLSDWQNMSKSVSQLSENNFWDSDWNQEKLLPWYILSEVCIMLENGENSIIGNLDKWMKDREKSEYLKDKFSEELSILSLIQNDVVASKHYNKYCFEKFLEEWTHLNPLFTKIRSKKLLNFQKNVDLHKVLNNNPTNELITYWQQNNNLSSYSLPSTELRTLYRQLFIYNLEQKCSESQEEHVYELKNIKLSNLLNLVQNAIDNNNYVVGRKYCKESKKFISSENKLGNFKLLLAMSKVGYIMAEKLEAENKLNTLTESWLRLDALCKKYSKIYPDLQIDSSRQIFKIVQTMHQDFSTNPSSYPNQKRKIQNYLSSSIDFLSDLQNYGVDRLRSSILQGEEELKNNESVKVLSSLKQAYITFVLYAQKQEEDIYKEEIVKFVLKAMKIGSKEARQIFPSLLQYEELNGELLDVFRNESSSVPTWMFLLWIPQLLIALEQSTKCVEEILERIGLMYPQSLVYTYKLAREKYDLNNCTTHFKNIIEKLDSILDNSLIDKFLEEMSYVCIPELYFNYYLEKIVRNSTDCKIVHEKIKDLNLDLKYRIQNRQNFKSVENSLHNLLQNIEGITDFNVMKNHIQKIHSDNKNKKKLNISIHRKLKYYSPWLANFKSSDYSTELEIPGQYTGENKPLVKYHAKICNFKHEISCKKTSLRKPFQITISGNDSKEYMFLVKFGEDLRQDQKIQQLFSLTNNILKSDKNCKERNLYLEQYQVIPLTNCLGLIKFYENTKPLSDFIFQTVKDPEAIKKYKSVHLDYLEWITNVASGQKASESDCYGKACILYDKNEVNMMFTRFVNAIPSDILSKSFWSMSPSPSVYHHLRHQFITSYSSMCIVHWILGIGDRNLGNTLISLSSGRVVGIDFGYAFGSTTQHSFIPELIPFRLTPHILELVSPLKSIGIVEFSMLYVLKAVRRMKQLLETSLDVFIKDPSVDWLESAKNSQNLEEENVWAPEFKIDIVKRKLDGANSAAITIRELRSGVIHVPQVKEAYVNVVKGDENSKRGKYNMSGLTEEEQVICLIDHATDYNILGRQYAGLELWI